MALGWGRRVVGLMRGTPAHPILRRVIYLTSPHIGETRRKQRTHDWFNI